MKKMVGKLRQCDRFISTLILFGIMIIALVQIALRSLFNIPMVGVEELSRYLFIAFVFLGLPYAYRMDGHIKLTGIRQYLPDRFKKTIDISIEASSFIVFAIIAFSSIYTTVTNYQSATLTLAIPFWLFFLPTCVGFTLLAIEHLNILIQTFNRKG
ncbi:TRAP transporter small permease [Planctomycetota bacterium]